MMQLIQNAFGNARQILWKFETTWKAMVQMRVTECGELHGATPRPSWHRDDTLAACQKSAEDYLVEIKAERDAILALRATRADIPKMQAILDEAQEVFRSIS